MANPKQRIRRALKHKLVDFQQPFKGMRIKPRSIRTGQTYVQPIQRFKRSCRLGCAQDFSHTSNLSTRRVEFNWNGHPAMAAVILLGHTVITQLRLVL
jgi:hypothetical protein